MWEPLTGRGEGVVRCSTLKPSNPCYLACRKLLDPPIDSPTHGHPWRHILSHQYSPTYRHPHCTHGTCGVLDCLLFCDQTRPNLRISLVGYHCAIEFPCGVPLFYCCKYPTTYGVRVHPVPPADTPANPETHPVIVHTLITEDPLEIVVEVR